MMKIRVLIADDQTLFREALEQALALERDIEVIGGAADGEETVHKALSLKPEVVLMDLKMPRLDGISAARRIKESLPECRIIMMTLFGDEEYVHQAILAGAAQPSATPLTPSPFSLVSVISRWSIRYSILLSKSLSKDCSVSMSEPSHILRVASGAPRVM